MDNKDLYRKVLERAQDVVARYLNNSDQLPADSAMLELSAILDSRQLEHAVEADRAAAPPVRPALRAA